MIEDAVELPVEETPVEDAADRVLDEEILATDDAGPESEPQVEDDTSVDAVAEEATAVGETSPPPPVDATSQRRGGFLPLAAGGLVAGGLGFLAAWQGFGQDRSDVTALVEAQNAQIETLSADVAALPDQIELPTVPDLAPLEASLDAMRAESAEGLAGLTQSLAALEERVTAVERAPGEDGGLTQTAVDSFEREVASLREEIAAQQTRIQELAEGAAADLEAARAETMAIEAQAQAAAEAAAAEAQAALASAAISEIRTALETGTSFADPVAALAEAGIAVPDVLQAAAEDGVASTATLAASFPAAARSGLAVARSEGVDDTEGGGGLGAFFQSQLGARSVEPREGNDADAILSRAEAAVGAGDLAAALSEIDALPDVVRAELSDWLLTAKTRDAALSAVADLDTATNN